MEELKRIDIQIEDGNSINFLYDEIISAINKSQLTRNTIIGILENIKFQCQTDWWENDQMK